MFVVDGGSRVQDWDFRIERGNFLSVSREKVMDLREMTRKTG